MSPLAGVLMSLCVLQLGLVLLAGLVTADAEDFVCGVADLHKDGTDHIKPFTCDNLADNLAGPPPVQSQNQKITADKFPWIGILASSTSNENTCLGVIVSQTRCVATMADAAIGEVITSDAFLNNTAPRQDTLHQMFVTGVAEIPDLLTNQGYIEEGDTGTTWVSTVVRTDEEGVATQIFLSVKRAEHSIKFKAKKLFADAPDNARIRLASLNLHAFEFVPSSNASNWVSSNDLSFMVMKGATMDQGTYTTDELSTINVTGAVFRLVVTPVEDINQASVSLVALPIPKDSVSSLPGSPTGHCPGYPVIEVYRFLTTSMTGIQSPIRQDGFPFLPILLSTASPAPVPDVQSIKKALYTFWSSMLEPNLMSLAMWKEETKGPAAPNTDQVRTAYTWPEMRDHANIEEESDAESAEGDDDNEDRYLRLQARRLAADINRAHRRDHPRGGGDGGGPGAADHRRAGGDGGGPGAPDKDKENPRRNSSSRNKDDPKKRRSKTRSAAGSGSDSDIDQSKPSKRMKASSILNKEDWPPGYTKAQIDEMGADLAFKLSEQHCKKKKKLDEGLPGVKVSSTDVKIGTVSIKAGKDNANDVLHPQRFEFRPCISPPKDWWHKIKEEWPDRKKQFASRYLGTGSSIPMKTFLAANDRTTALRSRHFLEKNYAVDTRQKKGKAKLNEDGSLEYEGFDKNYFNPETVQDMIIACMNLQAVCYQLWPWDYTPQVILRVANRYQFFVKGEDRQVKIFSKFFDKVLQINAEEPTKPPLTYDEAILVAVEVMEKNGCPPVVPIVQDYYDSFQKPDLNQNAPQKVPETRGRGRGRGGGGRGGRGGVWMPPGPQPSLGYGKTVGVVGKMPGDLKLLRVGNLQVCQRYNTTTGCKNTVDPTTGNCTVGNVTRAHICAIVVKVGQNGNNPRLCGTATHTALTCPNRK